MNAALRTQLRGAARRPVRLLVTGLAMVGAAFVVHGAVFAQEIAVATELDQLSGTPEGADAVVFSNTDEEGSDLLSAETLAEIRQLPGVEAATGRMWGYYPLSGTSADYLSVTADPGSGPLSRVELVRGSYPSGSGEVAVSPRTLDRLGLSIGGSVSIEVADGESQTVALRVTGVVTGTYDAGWDAYTTDDLASALATEGGYERIEVRLTPEATIDAVRTALGPGFSVRDAEQVRMDEATEASSSVRTMFILADVFVVVAVAAAVLVAISAFRIVFAQRMRQLALLRTVGAGRGTLFRALAAEGVLTGLVAGTVGVLCATAVGTALPTVAGWFDYDLSSSETPVAAGVAVVLGTAVLMLVAVVAPAFSAARVSPLEALRSAGVSGGRGGIGMVRAVCGIALVAGAGLAVAAAVISLPQTDEGDHNPLPTLLIIVASGVMGFLALVALGPVLIRPVLAVVGWPLRRASPLGQLAVGGVGSAPRRGAALSVVVALGVTLVSGVLVLGESVRAMVNRELAASVPADFQVSAVDGQGIEDGWVDRARAQSELTNVIAFRQVELTLVRTGGSADSARTDAAVVDLVPGDLGTWDELRSTGMPEVVDAGEIVIAEGTAELLGVETGETVTVSSAGGSLDLRVAEVVDAVPVEASAVVSPSDLDQLGVDSVATALLADAASSGEAGRTSARAALRSVVGEDCLLSVLADTRDRVETNVRSSLAVLLAMIGLTVAIALVGVGSTAALSVVERIREAGLLRAIGLSPGGLVVMLILESALYGLIGATIGLALALPYAWLGLASLGAGIAVTLPVGQLIVVVLVFPVLTAAAGMVPAWRAARVSPMAALATDG